jgi:hypothetical protein
MAVSGEQRRALHLLAGSAAGATEAIMLGSEDHWPSMVRLTVGGGSCGQPIHGLPPAFYLPASCRRAAGASRSAYPCISLPVTVVAVKRMGGAFLACGFNSRFLSGSGVHAANTQGSMSLFGPWRRTQPLHRSLRRQRTAGMPMAAGTIQSKRHPGHHPAMTARR